MNENCSLFQLFINMMHTLANRIHKMARAKIFWVFLAAVFCCFPIRVQASDQVLLVLSSDALPYRQAATSLELSLAEGNIKSVALISQELEAQSFSALQKQYSPSMWVAIGSRAAAQVNKLIPSTETLVYCMVVNPQKVGIDPARGQVAGVSVVKSLCEQFSIIKTAMPTLDSIAMLYRSTSEQSVQTLNDVKKHLPKGWKLEAVDIDSMRSQAAAIQELFDRKSDLIWTSADSSIYNRAIVKSMLLSSLRSGIPVFGFSGSFVKAGALLGLDANPATQGKYAASLVKECLGLSNHKGCLLASGVTLSVNLVVADRLGIKLSDELLAKATVVSTP